MNDRVVLVTGGAGNLGQAVTRAFLAAGARVAVPFYKTDHPTALGALSEEYGDRLHTFALDLTTERGAEQAIRQTVEWGGQIGSIAHLVGGYLGGYSIVGTPLEAWHRMIELNMTSAYLVTRFGVPRLLEAGGGSLVFVASRAAFEKRSDRSAYAVSKAGVVALAKAVAEEFGSRGIRSNVIVPDTIDTDDNRRANPDADTSGWVPPEEIAEIILFLASSRSAPINGASVPVYAGS